MQAQRAGDLLLRTVGVIRARAKIGLRNLAYNLDRMGCCWRQTTGEVRPRGQNERQMIAERSEG